MKKGWTTAPLGQIGEFKRGGSFKKSDFVKEGFPCIHYGQIHTKFGITTSTHLSNISQQIFERCPKAQKGDLIIAITSEDVEGSCKCTVWLGDYDVALGGHIARFRHELNPEYVAYYFMSPQFQLAKEKFTHGFKVVEIKPSDIAKIKISYPDKKEQEQVVAIINSKFSKIDQLRHNSEIALEEAKALYMSTLNNTMMELDTFRNKKIGEIFKTYSGGTPLKSHPEFYLNGNIPWLQSGEINKKYIFSTEKYITDVGLRNSSAKYYPVNTVLVAMYGATAGQVGILKTEATSNQAICGILPDNQFMPEFVYYWFLNIQKKLVALARGGAQPNISQVKIKSMPIPVVPLSVQHDIVDKLNSIETNILKLEDNYNKITSELLLLKQSILREIFD